MISFTTNRKKRVPTQRISAANQRPIPAFDLMSSAPVVVEAPAPIVRPAVFNPYSTETLQSNKLKQALTIPHFSKSQTSHYSYGTMFIPAKLMNSAEFSALSSLNTKLTESQILFNSVLTNEEASWTRCWSRISRHPSQSMPQR